MNDNSTLADQVKQLEARVRVLEGPHVEIVARDISPTGEEVAGPHAEVVVAEGPPPGQSLADWLSSLGGSPGLVVDPGTARATSCIALELDASHPPRVYSKGIIGPLDEEQQALYCQEGIEHRPLSPEQRERMEIMAQAAPRCSEATKPLEDKGMERIEAYLGCMATELKSRGHESW